jgi:hypothetical protein
VIDLAEQENSRIAGDALVLLADLDAAVERGLPEPSLAFTHDVNLRLRGVRWTSASKDHTEGGLVRSDFGGGE